MFACSFAYIRENRFYIQKRNSHSTSLCIRDNALINLYALFETDVIFSPEPGCVVSIQYFYKTLWHCHKNGGKEIYTLLYNRADQFFVRENKFNV